MLKMLSEMKSTLELSAVPLVSSTTTSSPPSVSSTSSDRDHDDDKQLTVFTNYVTRLTDDCIEQKSEDERQALIQKQYQDIEAVGTVFSFLGSIFSAITASINSWTKGLGAVLQRNMDFYYKLLQDPQRNTDLDREVALLGCDLYVSLSQPETGKIPTLQKDTVVLCPDEQSSKNDGEDGITYKAYFVKDRKWVMDEYTKQPLTIKMGPIQHLLKEGLLKETVDHRQIMKSAISKANLTHLLIPLTDEEFELLELSRGFDIEELNLYKDLSEEERLLLSFTSAVPRIGADQKGESTYTPTFNSLLQRRRPLALEEQRNSVTAAAKQSVYSKGPK